MGRTPAKKRGKSSVHSNEDDDDEVDKYMKSREAPVHDDDSEDEEESDEAVMDIVGGSSSEEDDDDEEGFSDDDLLGAEAEEEEDGQQVAWGRKKEEYYDADNVDVEIDSDSDDALEEEKEARRMQKQRGKKLTSQDFGDDMDVVLEKRSKPTKDKRSKGDGKSNDAKLLEKLNTELDTIGMGKSMTVESVRKDVSRLSKQEKLDLVLNDAPELLDLISEFQDKTKELRSNVVPMIQKIKSNTLPTTHGVSFLEVKMHLLLTYCTNIGFYLLLKSEGRSVKDHPVIDRLVETRTLLEKLRPLDSKLKYQIEKLMKAAPEAEAEMIATAKKTGRTLQASGDGGDADGSKANPLRFKPDLSRLNEAKGGAIANDGGDELVQGSHGLTDGGVGDGVYRPSRVAPVHFDEKKSAKKERRLARKSEKVNNSEMVRAMREEFGDEPLEESNIGSRRERDEAGAILNERDAYEEEHFVRLSMTKKEKQQLKKAQRPKSMGAFDDFDDFADMDAVAGAGEKKELELLKKRSFEDYISQAQGDGARSKAPVGGDVDLPRRDRGAAVQRAADRRAKREGNTASGGDTDMFGGFGGADDDGVPGDANDMEDPFYAATKAAKRKKKESKTSHVDFTNAGEDAFAGEFQTADDGASGGRRGVGRDITGNRGLTPHRNKDKKNPRKKHRLAFEKKSTNLRTGQFGKQKQSGPYGGETTGISRNVTRSSKF